MFKINNDKQYTCIIKDLFTELENATRNAFKLG